MFCILVVRHYDVKQHSYFKKKNSYFGILSLNDIGYLSLLLKIKTFYRNSVYRNIGYLFCNKLYIMQLIYIDNKMHLRICIFVYEVAGACYVYSTCPLTSYNKCAKIFEQACFPNSVCLRLDDKIGYFRITRDSYTSFSAMHNA